MYYDELLDNVFNESDDLMLEYSGKPEMNERFEQALKDMDNLIKNDVYQRVPKVLALCNEMLKKANIAVKGIQKGDRPADSYLVELREALREDISKYNEQCTTSDAKTTANKNYLAFKEFRKISKKFAVKYSIVTMEMKKKYDKIFSEYYDDLVKETKDWVAWNEYDARKSYDQLCRDHAVFMSFNYYLTVDLTEHYINPILNCMFNNVCGAAGMIQWTRYKLGIQKENSALYKFVQRLFKDKSEKSTAAFKYGIATESFIYFNEDALEESTFPVDYTITMEEIEEENFVPYQLYHEI